MLKFATVTEQIITGRITHYRSPNHTATRFVRQVVVVYLFALFVERPRPQTFTHPSPFSLVYFAPRLTRIRSRRSIAFE